jgi:hypothetical protein
VAFRDVTKKGQNLDPDLRENLKPHMVKIGSEQILESGWTQTQCVNIHDGGGGGGDNYVIVVLLVITYGCAGGDYVWL